MQLACEMLGWCHGFAVTEGLFCIHLSLRLAFGDPPPSSEGGLQGERTVQNKKGACATKTHTPVCIKQTESTNRQENASGGLTLFCKKGLRIPKNFEKS